MPTKLKDLVFQELSLVDRPANKGALVLLAKREGNGGISDDVEPKADDITKAKQMQNVAKALGLAEDADEAAVVAAVAKAKADGEAALAAVKAELELAKANLSADEHKFHDGLKDDAAKAEFRGFDHEARKAAMAKAVELPADVAKRLAEADEMRKRLETLEAKDTAAAMTKKATEAGLPAEFSATLTKAYAGDKAGVDALVAEIAKLNEQVNKGDLFKEFGTARGGDGLEPYAQITAKAEEVRKSNPKLTIEQAKALVIENPANVELVKAYNEAKRKQVA